ncbi:MAG: helix-hairpin-helix domain-containing protein [Bacteroidaceae bacterium]|nr:helix-hairpin-helix domain-containing protein [Bacteroidaceae bacterium]
MARKTTDGLHPRDARPFFYAQNAYTWQDFVEDVTDEPYAEEQGWTETMEELALLADHPMDINTATREQLGQLPFLSEEQIRDIHTYILLHRGMRTLSELMAIPSIDFRTRRYLSLFLRADPAVFERKDTLTLRSLLRHSRHEFASRIDIPLYYRLGYSYPPHSGGYAGSPLYHNVRYRLSARNHVEAGLSAEKDPGEPFLGNRGWDSYGGYLMLRNIRRLRSVVFGDYKMGFGEGLVVNSGFPTGKSGLMNRPAQGIRAKRGTDETDYFRGAATVVRVGNVDLTAWVSHRRLDATLNADGTARTILRSGLHRTESELSKKRNLGSTLTGGNVQWQHQGLHLGATGYFQRFHRVLSPGDALYRKIYPAGRNFGAASLSYGYARPWFFVAGETAYSTEKGGWATLNRATWKISPDYTLTGSHRFYSYKYYSFYASALSENSNVQNESGAMLRMDATPVERLTVMLYIDFFYNPWPRYNLDHSSSGQELLARAEYQLNRRNSLMLRYQLKRKEQGDGLQPHHRLRLQYTRRQGQHWQMQSLLNLHRTAGSSLGWALSQRVRMKHDRLSLSSILTYFHTPDYRTRIFIYEPLLSGMYRYPSFYGHGLRLSAAVHYELWERRLRLELLYGLLRYTDRSVQGTGMQEIRSPWKQDISLQLRLRI